MPILYFTFWPLPLGLSGEVFFWEMPSACPPFYLFVFELSYSCFSWIVIGSSLSSLWSESNRLSIRQAAVFMNILVASPFLAGYIHDFILSLSWRFEFRNAALLSVRSDFYVSSFLSVGCDALFVWVRLTPFFDLLGFWNLFLEDCCYSDCFENVLVWGVAVFSSACNRLDCCLVLLLFLVLPFQTTDI